MTFVFIYIIGALLLGGLGVFYLGGNALRMLREKQPEASVLSNIPCVYAIMFAIMTITAPLIPYVVLSDTRAIVFASSVADAMMD